MGACVSSSCEGCHGSSSPPPPPTKVLLILEDGKLRELSFPVRAAQALSDSKGAAGCSSWFLCDADDMEFDGGLTAVGAEEQLRPGQLYFVLPRSMLKRRLLPEEMAALAVRASAALLECGSSASFAAQASGEWWEDGGRTSRVAPVGGFTVGTATMVRRTASGGRRNYSPRLGAISE